MLDRRQKAIDDSIDSAERTREEADKLLAEYRERLHDARGQAEEIVTRARRAAEEHEHEAVEAARARGEHLMEQTRRDIEAATQACARRDPRRGHQPHDPRRREGDAQDARQRRPAAARRGGARRARLLGPVRLGELAAAMEEIAAVYSRALFEAALDAGRLDEVRDQLAQLADAMRRHARSAGLLLLPVLLDRGEARRAAPARSATPTRCSPTSSSC